MATDIKLKRYNGDEWQTFHPETNTDQVIGLSSALSDKVDKSSIGEVNGIAPLNSDKKIELEYLPETAITGMEMTGVIVDESDAGSFINDTAGVAEKTGNYEIISSSVSDSLTLDMASIQPDEPCLFKDPQGEYSYKESIDVQSGDWLVYTGYEFEDTAGDYGPEGEIYYIYAVIDNNQADRYLNKAGGTMSGHINMDGNNVSGFDTISGKKLSLYSDDLGHDFTFEYTDDLVIDNNKIWHEGNFNPDNKSDTGHEHNENDINIDGGSFSYFRSGTDVNLSHVLDDIDDEFKKKTRTSLGSSEPSYGNIESGDLWFDTSG